jgi:hypothetical protein
MFDPAFLLERITPIKSRVVKDIIALVAGVVAAQYLFRNDNALFGLPCLLGEQAWRCQDQEKIKCYKIFKNLHVVYG